MAFRPENKIPEIAEDVFFYAVDLDVIRTLLMVSASELLHPSCACNGSNMPRELVAQFDLATVRCQLAEDNFERTFLPVPLGSEQTRSCHRAEAARKNFQ